MSFIKILKGNNSKLKIDLLQNMYNSNFLCEKGHNLDWIGIKKLSWSELKCDKCGENNTSTNPIRWSCEECQLNFCAICYKILADKFCPSKHRLKFSKQSSVDFFSSYTCDYCFEKYNTNIQDVYPVKDLMRSKELIYHDGYIKIPEDKIYVMNEILVKLL